MSTTQWQKMLEIPGRVLFSEGNGDLPRLEINTPWSSAEIYLHGAHITHFQKKGEAPLLFLSKLSRFNAGTPIRGGIPIIFPWFGAREGEAAHGFARTQTWELREVGQLPSGGVKLSLSLPDSPSAALFQHFSADYSVIITDKLTAVLKVVNLSEDKPFVFEDCLHTYFTIGDVDAVRVAGLKGADYLDKTDNLKRKTELPDQIKITGETDRTYLDTTSTVEIHDPTLGRKIVVEKTGSLSTVVWNPWIEKSAQMPDFGDEEYQKMICVESGNVADNRIQLPAGKAAELKIELSTVPS